MTRLLSSCLLACLLSATAMNAQAVATARTIRTAVILDQPRGDGVVVTSVPPGVVIEVLGQYGQWYQVRLLPEGGASGLSGWLHGDLMEWLQRSPVPEVPFTSQPAPPEVSAQPAPTPENPRVREGLWFNAGLGYGWLGCENCIDRLGGASGGLALGGTVSDRVLLGVGTTGWYKSESGITLSAATLDARIRIYPVLSSGFFLTGGLGIGTISLGAARLSSERETGLGLTLGLGWDIRVGSNVSLTPFWNGTAVSTSNADANFGQIGLGVTIH
jgi:hypothetical protein